MLNVRNAAVSWILWILLVQFLLVPSFKKILKCLHHMDLNTYLCMLVISLMQIWLSQFFPRLKKEHEARNRLYFKVLSALSTCAQYDTKLKDLLQFLIW